MSGEDLRGGLTRRDLIRRAGAGSALLAFPALLAACGDGGDGGSSGSTAAAAPATSEAAASSAASTTATTGQAAPTEATSQAQTDAAGSPTRGGRLRVGFVGGGSAEQLDPNRGSVIVEIAMATMMFEKLYELRGPDAELTPVLAESFESNATGDVWTLRVRDGIAWHDGKPFSIDDVIYTFQRILDEKNALAGASVLGFLDPKGMKRIDDRTAELSFLTPFADPFSPMTTRFLPIVQNGATDFTKPIGTGPFAFESFVAGKGGVFVANPEYRDGAPYVDAVEVVDLPDATARVNALLSGQVDAIEALPGAQASTLGGNGDVKVLESPNGGHSKMCFTATSAPFDDPRVRQALRLLCDRQKTIDNAVFGLGEIGNDLTCRFDPMYASDIAQREYDPEQAKSLLAAAGHADLQVQLDSSSAAVGMLESAQVFAETARAGGVTVKVRTIPADQYYSTTWGNAPFFQDEWGVYSLHDQLALNYATEGAYNGFKYSNPKVDALLQDASATLDDAARKDKYRELQQILWDEGPDIVWGSPSVLDAVSANVNGLEPSPVRPLGAFRFEKAWLAS